MNDSLSIEAPGVDRPLALRFTGSGSEYFRIWVVNLLLTLLTLGIYFPWARVRRLRYFYASTLVGSDPLDFHGRPSRMLRGYALVGVLFALHSVAGKLSAWAGLVALVIVAAVGPALLRAGLRFRLANTRWRGLRFGFVGEMTGVYRAVLPLSVPAVVASILTALTSQGDASPPGGSAWAGIGALLIAALLPLSWWRLKRYQHDHLAFGQERTHFDARVGPVYKIFLQLLLVAIVAGAIAIVVLFGAMVAARIVLSATVAGKWPEGWQTVLGIGIAVLAFYLTATLVVRPFAAARLQDLVWNHTTSANLRFSSRLAVRRVLRLTLKNWLLTLATLGFYAPFAAVAMARLRIEAVTIRSRIDPAELVQEAGAVRVDDAAGDAAGELFGIDLGL